MTDHSVTDLLSRVQSALHGRYEVRRELGRGGMAIVYLAEDVRHHRQVAIKVFQPELAGTVGHERFLREIQVAANLTHPHILPLYDSGEADGLLYYVMPYVQGETLRERLRRVGQLTAHEAVRIASELTDALGYAHRQGLVHRDIKPENVMLANGHALVMDFGICRAVDEASSGEGLTRAGLTLGTPAYMSPEQWSTPDRVGERSDIYSLGCVLYEMLVGEPPFTGTTAAMILARHTQQDMPSVRVVRPDIPESIEAALRRALAKVPEARYSSAFEFGEELQSAITLPSITIPGSSPTTSEVRTAAQLPRSAFQVRRRTVLFAAIPLLLFGISYAVYAGLADGRDASAAKAAGPDLKTVAVLYFDDLTRGQVEDGKPSGAGELGYLADALTEDLIKDLSTIRQLDVISRNGVTPFRSRDVPRDSVARVLGAGTLVDGSVEKVRNRIRVSLRLVDGTSGAEVKRASFEQPAGKLLDIRDEAVERTGRLLREWLGEEIRMRERERGTESVEAWALVQRAEKLRKDAEVRNRARQPGADQLFDQADSMLARAERLDTRWIEPPVMRAQIAYRRARVARDAPVITKWLDQGFGHAERALVLDRKHARALEVRGSLSYWKHLAPLPIGPEEDERLLNSAREDLEAAVRIDPTLASAHNVLSYVYSGTNITSVVLAASRAYEEDAYLEAAPAVLWTLFSGSLDLQQFAQAKRWCDEGVRRFPDRHRFAECQLVLHAYPGVEADPTLAWKLAARLDSLAPEPQRAFYHEYGATHVAGALARAGQADSARSVLLRVRQRTTPEADPNGELIVYEAYIRTLLGDLDVAIDLLKRRIAGGQPRLNPNEEMNWRWRPLIDRPRFREISVAG